MNTRKFYLNNLWRWKCNLEEISEQNKEDIINVDELYQTEWSPEFEAYMHNRLVMGAIRYGKINQNGKPKYDRTGTMHKKIDLYLHTGNKECLVDLANYAMVEYMEPTINGTYFEATDDQHHDTVIG